MYPPSFHPSHAVEDWPACHLEAHCPRCSRMTIAPVRMLAQGHGRLRLLELTAKLRCHTCGTRAAPVYLVAGRTRTFQGGLSPDWALGLVPPSRPSPYPQPSRAVKV